MKDSIKILGAYGAKTDNTAMTCIQVDHEILIDAGNILLGLEEKAQLINHIFLTHTHLDHIADIPFLVDVFFDERKSPLFVYGTKGTLENLKKYIFNWEIWPDFTKIPLDKNAGMAIQLIEINIDETTLINDTKIKAIKNNHTDGSCGYVIEKNDNAIFFTSDTGKCKNIWDEINNNKKINSVIIDVSFPSHLNKLAIDSLHLTPKLLHEDLVHLQRDDVKIFINHLKPSFIPNIYEEVNVTYPNILNGGRILKDGDIINLTTSKIIEVLHKKHVALNHIDQLIAIGHSLSNEKDFDTLMEQILIAAKQLSNADAGTLYLLDEKNQSLNFKVVQTDSLNIQMGGTQEKITWNDLDLYTKDGKANNQQVAALCALTGKLINIPDVYTAEGFNFEGTKSFDKGTGYRTQSMLVVPMKNHENDIIGVVQLLNKKEVNGEIIVFDKNDEKLLLSMSSQAAVSITNTRLIEDLEKLLLDFIKSTADAISEKSKYTGGHINRVAELATMIALAINEDKVGIYKNKVFTKDELNQIDIAGWMHDIGKITTPEYVVDKATKLETIYDRIHEVIAKFEIVKRDLEITYLKAKLASNDEKKHVKLKEAFDESILKINEDINFIKESNKGVEFVDSQRTKKINEISKLTLSIQGKQTNVLNKDQLYNMQVTKGTLTKEERITINNHVITSYNMLKSLSFPKKLQRVPIIAGSHHKTIYKNKDGNHGGYGAPEIMGEDMSLEDRILAVADVFEAVTASDRPYKNPNSLNQSLNIMSDMVKANELDRDIVKFFIDNKVYAEYVEINLLEEQLDEINVHID